MGGIPQDIITRIQEQAEIVSIVSAYVPLQRRGEDFWACCPFHEEKTPSFKVNATRQVYYCFGCQRSGNVFRFVMEQENLDFVGAVRLLAQQCGVRIPATDYKGNQRKKDRKGGGDAETVDKDELFKLLDQVCQWYQQQLQEATGEVAQRYLSDRGLTDDDFVQGFQLGYAPDCWDAAINWGVRQGYTKEMLVQAGMAVKKETGHCYDRFRGRLMFPIHDELGRVVGFSGRSLAETSHGAKYINTPETALFRKNRVLYGLHKARREFKNRGAALVCEGQLDVIAYHRAGMPHAVAPQGTAFTETHARILSRYTDSVVFAFDADAAGVKAVLRSIKMALANGLYARVAVMPGGADPDSILQQQGAAELKRITEEAEDAYDYLLRNGEERYSIQSPEEKAVLVNEIVDVIACVNDAVGRAARCQWLSKKLNLPESAVFDRLSTALSKRQGHDRKGGRVNTVTAASGATAGTGTEAPAGSSEEKILLDLVLNFPEIAEQLAERLPSDRIGQSRCGQGLEKMLRHTLEKDWHTALEAIRSDTELMGIPEVGRSMVQSSFSNLDPGAADIEEEEAERRRQKLFRAMNDCLTRLEDQYLERRARSLEERMKQESHPGRARELLIEGAALRRKREELKQYNFSGA